MTSLIWDIQREHLNEAEFLVETWLNCIDSPRFTLSKLAEGPEERLLARLAGLVVGGEPVVERLLLPVVAAPDDDEFRTTAATLAILQGAGLDACEQVLTAFDTAGEVGHRGLVRALQLARRNGLIQWLGRDLDALAGPALASRLLALAGHQVDAGARLIGWLEHEDIRVRRAAAHLARHTSEPKALARLQALLGADDELVRVAALDSGLIRGVPGAWPLAIHQADSRATTGPERAQNARMLGRVAVLGDGAVHRRLLAQLRADPGPDLLWAAGLSGRPAAVDAAVELLDQPKLARLAGEVVCVIAGLSPTDNQFWLDRGVRVGDDAAQALPELEDDDLDQDLVPAAVNFLRLPNPDEVRFWWAQRRDQFDPGLRHSNGRPFDRDQLARSLHQLPTRRRHMLAFELAVRTNGRAQLQTHALTAVQIAQTHAAFAQFKTLDMQAGLSPTA